MKEGAQKEDKLPSLFFLESTPSHFYSPSNINGYWHSDYIRSKSNCTPFENVSSTSLLDWRNRIPNEVFKNSKLTVIPIAEDLYSQYDAHMGIYIY